MRSLEITLKGAAKKYPIDIGAGNFADCGDWAANTLQTADKKVVLVSNDKVFNLYGNAAAASFRSAGFYVFEWKMRDGEEYKSLNSLEDLLRFLSSNGFARTDVVAALGGGVVGDLAGFAAAIYLRGIAFLQFPTTLLSMIDSSVGGKTAVNTEFGKNLIGSFYQPSGVFIDVDVLKTLEAREVTAGFCEAIKHGALAGGELFESTRNFLEQNPVAKFADSFDNEDFLASLANLVADQIHFKAAVVTQDEFEAAARTDSLSRKILNFGHTLAHALEKATDYRYFKHGEAVGYGILFAGELSKRLEKLDENRLNLLYDVVHRAGSLPKASNINKNKIVEAFAFDKKIVDNSLQWVFLKDLGVPVIRDGNDISNEMIEESLETSLES
ncbi:MAG: 3-dehydroquinate synthase [Pyrinomonadaceae bacterium]|nr:3-dehydroquinate synthase [Pyrinomonadaceae bacterium]